MDLTSLWKIASETQELMIAFPGANRMIVFDAASPLYTPKPVTHRLIDALRFNQEVLRKKML